MTKNDSSRRLFTYFVLDGSFVSVTNSADRDVAIQKLLREGWTLITHHEFSSEATEKEISQFYSGLTTGHSTAMRAIRSVLGIG